MNHMLEHYDAMACKAAAEVISHYSTSFAAATSMLAPRVRSDITNLYAMVRIADEIVDGTAQSNQLALLDAYEQQVLSAKDQRFHCDPVVHAFAISARRCKFKDEHLRAFFASMRQDLQQNTFDEEALARYIYGSAEVIGLMCLDAFLLEADADREYLDPGAQALGRAFQKINFLRDLHEDHHHLGRSYYPGIDDAKKDQVIREVRQELELARERMQGLPIQARVGVAAAVELYEELTNRVADRSIAEIRQRRVRVPTWKKLALAAKAAVKKGKV
ncbi:phytoene/squalene synthase family protein [Corynebacterium pelargi]|uniref:All-trans-phytoene synthase n=1 Tax=Corynebacterium pelargi TaxID=1471400 RepID=A0A410W6B1_9CORY|nr:squalene/phytoene synthase family protein [Corynebacterium pelargi]QAU51492.1 All-trans-phytoene synthase [Corynebacterium pelargi]GGG79536.1 phytoene synthase [Corynebacterium pelargi]